MQTLNDHIREFVLNRIRECGGNRLRSAQTLRISYTTLRNWVRQWKAAGVEVPKELPKGGSNKKPRVLE